MSDFAHKETDKEIERLGRKIYKEYSKALDEVKSKATAYFEQFSKEDEKKKVELKAGDITQKEYFAWRNAKMASGKRYTAMINDIAADLANTDQIAMKMIGEKLPDVYALNSNYAAYQICKDTGANISFDLVDHNTVERLIKEDPQLLPNPRVNIAKDQRWNAQKVRSALTQGILLGDSVPKIANRLKQVTDMDNRAAVRNARTMCTGAENAGRLDRYHEAEELGIKMDKEWMATLDMRTRDSHRHLDGEVVSVDEPFSNKLMYPGDPDGEPAEVYNCRCTMVSRIRGHEYQNDKRWSNLPEGMTYEEWKNGKEEELNALSIINTSYNGDLSQNMNVAREEIVGKTLIGNGRNGMGVSYEGISSESANIINKTIKKWYNTFDVDKLDGIYVVKENSKEWDKIKTTYMAYSPKRNSILINKNSCINKKALEKDIEIGDVITKKYINGDKKITNHKWNRITLKALQNSSVSGRAYVYTNMEECVNHELGHAMSKYIRKQSEWKSIKKNMNKYAENISGYACVSKDEYIAESFCSYLKGENVIDPKLKKIFERLKR